MTAQVRDNLTLDKHNVGMGTMYLGAYTSQMEDDEFSPGRQIMCHRHVSTIRPYWGNLSKSVEHGARHRAREARAARNYLGGRVPGGYLCGGCAATGIKLWREYQTCNPHLLCAPCACADQKKPDDIDAQGYHGGRRRGDQIGWYVPAVPDEERVGYWGYASVPQAGVIWWRRLPTRLSDAKDKE